MNVIEFVEKSNLVECFFEVTPKVYQSFQICSGDMNPLHTDEVFARQKGFTSCVMYGNILNAFVSFFVGMMLPIKDVMIQAQDINYRKPVFLNDKIRMVATIDSVSEAVNVVIYKYKFYRITEPKDVLVANGHVQIGLININNKE